MLLKARETHSCGVAVGNVELGGHQGPVNLFPCYNYFKDSIEGSEGLGYSYRFEIELLDDGVEKFGRLTICGHGLASSETCHVARAVCNLD